MLIRNARIVDVKNRAISEPKNLHIKGNKIKEILSNLSPIDDDNILEANNGFLLPGFIDTHIHLNAGRQKAPTTANPNPESDHEKEMSRLISEVEKKLASYLYCGVTSVHDAGNDEDFIFKIRQMERDGEIISPRIFAAGAFITAKGGHGSNLSKSVEIEGNPEESKNLLRLLSKKPDLLKITYDEHNWGVRPLIPILTPDQLRRIVEIIHENGFKVTVHASNELRSREVIAAGADALAHPIIQSPATDEFCDLIAELQIPISSTLAIGERYFKLADDPEYVDGGFYKECLPESERKRLRKEEHKLQKENSWADWMRVMTPIAQKNLYRYVKAGGLVATGTDLSLGAEIHREFKLLSDAELSTWQILEATTINAAKYLNKEAELGSVEKGKLADLVILKADPTEDVKNFRTITHVVKNGELINRKILSAKMLKEGMPIS